jgi:hypothetical protein
MSQNDSNVLYSSDIASCNAFSVKSNIFADNFILVLRAFTGVEKVSGAKELSSCSDVLEVIPRPVPMHTLAEVKKPR